MPDVFLEFTDHRHLPRSHLSGAGTVRLAERLRTALRLVNGNDVGIHSIWYIDENPFDRFPMPRRMWPDPIPPDRFGPQYVVTPDIEHQLREVWPCLATEPTESTLSLALRRLNDSYHRARSEDRLVDYWIALEALFLPKERTPDMGIAAALAISHYLGETVEDRRSIYEFVKASHSLRSDVVHPKSGPRDQQFDSKVTKTADVLRRSLRKRIGEYRL